jgi:hypothetical protein
METEIGSFELYRTYGRDDSYRPAVSTVDFSTYVIPPNKREIYSLLDYQTPVFHSLKDELFFQLGCPTGWGKTCLLQFLIIHYLIKKPDWRVVVLVPKKDVAPGFVARRKFNNEGKIVNWSTIYNLCGNIASGKKIKLHRFLKSPVGGTLESRILVTTHACFATGWGEWGSIDLINKTLFVIDEAHHIQSDEGGEDEIDAVTMNLMGKFVSFVLDHSNIANLWMSTATFGRGDSLDIIAKRHMDLIVFKDICFEDYWKSLRWLKTFQNVYVIYENTPFTAFTELLKKGKKTLVYCPRFGSKFLNGIPKEEFIERTREILLNSKKDVYIWKVGDKKQGAIVDLTDDSDRIEKIKYIEEHRVDVYSIIAVDMMKEGANWPPLEQIVDFAPLSKSATQRIQKFGRGTRDFEGKTHFTYFSFLPKITSLNEEDTRKRLSESFGQLILNLLESSYYCPIVEWEISGANGRQYARSNLFNNFDQNTRQKMLEEVHLRLISWQNNCRKYSLPLHKDKMISAVEDVLVEYEENEISRSLLAQQIILYISRSKKKNLQSIDEFVSVVDDLNFDKISTEHIISNIMSFCSCISGIETFTEMRDLIGKYDSREELFQMLDRARSYGDPGVLRP